MQKSPAFTPQKVRQATFYALLIAINESAEYSSARRTP